MFLQLWKNGSVELWSKQIIQTLYPFSDTLRRIRACFDSLTASCPITTVQTLSMKPLLQPVQPVHSAALSEWPVTPHTDPTASSFHGMTQQNPDIFWRADGQEVSDARVTQERETGYNNIQFLCTVCFAHVT